MGLMIDVARSAEDRDVRVLTLSAPLYETSTLDDATRPAGCASVGVAPARDAAAPMTVCRPVPRFVSRA